MRNGIDFKSDSEKREIFFSVVVPVYKNSETLLMLHERLTHSISSLTDRYEIIFVNDSCPYGSLDILKSIIQKDEQVGVVDLPQNFGQHLAILVGLANSRGDFIAVIDADLQDLPEAIPSLLSALVSSPNLDVILAVRKGEYESALRMFTSRVFKTLIQWICKIPRNAGSFCVMNRSTAERVLSLPIVKPYLLVLLSASGAQIGTVPVVRQKRSFGSSAYTEWKRLKLALSALYSLIALKYLRINSGLTFSEFLKTLPIRRLGAVFEGETGFVQRGEH
ncbi:MAG: glycosyltransferase family 2 protein [Armatimonadetes bacterium]|nr:glycosyltransferase family 2 protein [Armatimonadota bacterium]MDW8028991.1 glycosyltransferase family 2 protein [Armatimonadota bacterium]